MKRLFYPPPIKLVLLVIMLLLVGNTFLFAEGSRDFRNYPGHRLFYNVDQSQQLKVYAAEGEFINLGSSHVGINGGFMELYRPDGTLAATYDDTGGVAIINNDVEELDGPTGGGSTNGPGYIPGIFEVPTGQGGVWSIRLGYPNTNDNSFVSNLLNSDPWTRNVDQASITALRVSLSWDVTVTQGGAGNAGGTQLQGRLYSNEYISILDGNTRPGNPRSTSPTFYVLTESGYLYQVDFDRADPWGFPIHSNSLGVVNGNQTPTYMSNTATTDSGSDGDYTRSASPNSWATDEVYLYEPQAEDFGPIINNKIFFNLPDINMPNSALVADTDPVRNDTHTTWLFNVPPVLEGSVRPFTFRGILPANSLCDEELVAAQGVGGYFVFDTDLAGQATLSIDINNNGSFNDAVDLVLTKNVLFGRDSILWNGTDGTGAVITANPNFNFAFDLTVRGGEIHILMLDIENNEGGVTFTRMNGAGSPDNRFYFDHSGIGGDVSGGGTTGNALPTTTPFTYSNGFGDKQLLDQWAFIETNNFGTGTLAIAIEEDCNSDDHDNDGIPDVVDIDDDNDGVPDLLEFCHPDEGWACLPGGLDPSGDEDGDGIQNYQDANDTAVNSGCTDSNADGICDQIIAAYDTDGDNVPDHYDLDSDNDGISDLVEAGHNQPDTDGNGIIDGLNAVFGDNGFYNPLETDDTPNGVANYIPWDFDGDGIPDHDDLDSDNDGILDVVEAGYASSDSDQDGRVDDGNGNVPAVNSDGLVPLIDPAITGVGIPLPPDWDGDSVPDWHDLDSDQDGILDVVEAGYTASDSDQDGRIDDGNGNVPAVNSDGIPPVIDVNGTGVGIPLPIDWDSDGVPDWHDLDSDNDGILDVVEAGYIASDSDQDGRIDDGNGNIPAVNADGIAPIINVNGTGIGIPLPIDWDTDGVPDWHDLDSDNDGILDVIEGGYQGSDTNLDGHIDDGNGNIPTVNADGLPPVMDPAITNAPINLPPDTDNDAVRDWHDLDSDNDGINGTVENLNPDGDDDGIIGTGPITVDANGIAIADPNGTLTPHTPLVNTDNDGPGDFRDLDADGDLITDVIEGGLNDPDEDGIIGTGIPTVNVNGQATDGTTSNPPDSDGNGIPDFQQVDEDCEKPATPVLSADDTELCEGESVTFTATGDIGADINYEWTITRADGSSELIQTTTDPTLTISPVAVGDAGTYSVVAVKDTCSSDASNGVSIVVAAKPDAPTISILNNVFCEGERLEFASTVVPGDNVLYMWIFTLPDGRRDTLKTDSNPGLVIENLVPTNTGNYSVIAIVNGCPSDESNSMFIDVALGGLPDVTITSSADANNPACEGDDVTLTATGFENATYEWTGPNDFTAADSIVIIENATSAANGEYSVIITINGCPKTVGPVIVQVDAKPATPTISVDNATVCPGEGFTLSTSTATGTAISYDWLLNGTLITTTTDSTLEIASPTDADAGNYTVIVRDGNCPSDPSDPVEVTVQPEVEGDITMDPADGVCEGESISLSAPTVDGATYEWTGPNGFTSTDVTITLENVTADANGDYSVVVTVNECPTNLGPVTLAINQKPATPSISADKNSVCPGDGVTLSTDPAAGDAITYDWLLDGTVVATTNDPTFEITDFQEANAGDYTVVVKDGSCPSESSEPVSVALQTALEGATASSNSPVCIGDPIMLMATAIDGATYEWTGPNGFSSDEANPTIENATTDDAGDYIVTITVDGCPATLPPTTVEVTPKPPAPTITLNETEVCEGTPVTITVSDPTDIPDGTTFTVLDADGNTIASGSTATIEVPTDGLDSLNTFTVISTEDGGCPSEPSNPVDLVVIPKPDETAMILPPMGGGECGETTMNIEATVPTQGTGMWSSDNPDVIFADPSNPTTEVAGLSEGDNVITWTLSNEACGEYSSEMVTITVMSPTTTANDDSFILLNSESVTNGDIIGNDQPGGEGAITIISGPSNGTATLSGNAINYTPNETFVGTDQIEYELCNVTCPDAPCDRAIVTFTVNQDPSNLECMVPDVITPNNDGLNDALVIPCSDFKNVGLKIFNRWGDLVFESNNYANNWIGTHDGDPLPPGPYYYIFEEDGAEPITGCVAIAR